MSYKQTKVKVTSIVAGALAAVLMPVGVSTAVFAAGDGSQASPCGAVHGAYADVNGNFGWLGAEGGTPGHHGGATGQDAGATGYNNSHTGCQE